MNDYFFHILLHLHRLYGIGRISLYIMLHTVGGKYVVSLVEHESASHPGCIFSCLRMEASYLFLREYYWMAIRAHTVRVLYCLAYRAGLF